MATQPEDDEDDTLNLTEVVESEESEERNEDDPENPEVNDEDDETVVSFDGEEPEPETDNSVIRQMRQELRETKKRLAEAEKASAPKPIDVGEEPDFDDPKYEYDQEKFKAEWKAWNERKAVADKQNASQAEQNRKANEDWQQDLVAFETKKTALEFSDRDDAIDTATGSLDLVQQAVVVKAASDPALFLYALGKSEAKRAELAKIQDPIKLAAAVARMEGAVKVTKGRKAPEPDRPLTGSARMPGGADKELEKLEKKAAATGDRSELIRYKKDKGLLGR